MRLPSLCPSSAILSMWIDLSYQYVTIYLERLKPVFLPKSPLINLQTPVSRGHYSTRLCSQGSDIATVYFRAATLAPLQWVHHAVAHLANNLKPFNQATLPFGDCTNYRSSSVSSTNCVLSFRMHPLDMLIAAARLSDMLIACVDVQSFSRLCTLSSGDCIILRTELGERVFAVSAPLVWNYRKLEATKCTATFQCIIKLFVLNRRIYQSSPSRRRTKSHTVNVYVDKCYQFCPK